MVAAGERRVALVTGASRGIGAAIGRRLAAEGMAVALNSHPDERMVTLAKQVAEDIVDAGGTALVIPADVAEPADVQFLFEECERELGRVGTLVLNAAATVRRSWTEIGPEEWDRIIGVNLRGAFLCSQRAFRSAEVRDGCIVTVSSVLARTGAPSALHYGTSKAGVIGFTRSLARELGPRGIRVNCVVPGAIRTEEEEESFADRAQTDRAALRHQVIGRRGTADDVAGVVSFLAGPDSRFMTGQAVGVDGGWTLT
ncbi:3-oxoacyl-[acyl-carrier protein] reductase [Amycolatopsis thermoflava]|uniref:3-oxoacyl-[acyl-carrier protein] reductase n=1 Tax=Amycolatopsis thermoflava TaxID=84480 RepID=A0A3N2GVL3_9PSEU|nr:3-oxoacyl-[acyl-carrier protein] reductase [Amycolatopsis thermoflava]